MTYLFQKSSFPHNDILGGIPVFTKKDLKFLMKNPEYFALIAGLAGIILGYLKYGIFYYVIGGISCALFVGLEGRILYRDHVREQQKKKAIINHKFNDLRKLNGYQFEEFVADCLSSIGYKTEVTKKSGDYGADIIAQFQGKKIAIQVKHYQNKVEYKAVQQALSGKNYYGCAEAWVITSNNDFTRQAKLGASKLDVRLFTIGDFALFLDQNQKKNRR